jgi:Sec-independent protein secretion pathway component TatC
MQIAFVILGILVVGAIVGSLINFMNVFLGIPFVLLFVGALIGKETLERQNKIMQMKRFQRDARTRKVEFSDADKRTMV